MSENRNVKNHHPLWEKPMHFTDAVNVKHSVHWIELFYDLVHVVAIFFLSGFLSDNFTLTGVAIFTLLFGALWVSWGDYVFYNSMFVSRDYKHRIISAVHIATVLIMAASFTSFLSGGWQYFVGAYAANRLITGILYWRAKRHNVVNNTLAQEMSRNFLCFGILTVLLPFLPFIFGMVGLFLILVGIQLSYILPRYGTIRFTRFTPRIDHLAERFSLLLLICLGEGFFKMTSLLQEASIDSLAITISAAALGTVSLFFLAWMYFDFVGNRQLRSTDKKDMMQWWYSHMTLMFAAVLVSIGLKEVVTLASGDTYAVKYELLAYIGLTLYILMLGSIQHVIHNPLVHRFVKWRTRFIGIGLLIIAAVSSGLGYSSSIGNTLFFVAIVSQLAIPILTAYNTLKLEVQAMRKRVIENET